jgi:nucleoside phosphorylase
VSAVDAPPARFGDGLCARAAGPCTRPVLAVFGAFPAELDPLLARATVRETLVIGDRVLRIGTVAGVPVVLGLLGIGMVNAAATTRLVLDHFDVAAFVVSGNAGSPRRIGDVTVPETWTGPDGIPHAADAAMLDRAREVAAAGVPLERCTEVPPEPPGPVVCLDFEPAIFVGGAGESGDPFGGRPLPCNPGGDEVFGCDVRPDAVGRGLTAGASVVFDATDEETAAVGREVAARDLPFVAFRAVSDGAGDPLGLPGFPAQFFAYYRLAARNAAAATAAFVERWGANETVRGAAARGAPVVRASCDWARRATPACAGRRASPTLRTWVNRACRSLVRDPLDPAAVTRAWERAARLAAQGPARRRLGRTCARELAAALQARAQP